MSDKLTKLPESVGTEMAQQVITNDRYKAMLLARAIAGVLPPVMEKHLWELAFGKATQKVKIEETPHHLESRTTEDLVSENAEIIRILRDRQNKKDLRGLARDAAVLASAEPPAAEPEPETVPNHFANLSLPDLGAGSGAPLPPGSKRTDH